MKFKKLDVKLVQKSIKTGNYPNLAWKYPMILYGKKKKKDFVVITQKKILYIFGTSKYSSFYYPETYVLKNLYYIIT